MTTIEQLLHPLGCRANRYVMSGGVSDETMCDCGLREAKRAVGELARLRALVQRFSVQWPRIVQAIATGQHQPFCTALYRSETRTDANPAGCDCFDCVDDLINFAAQLVPNAAEEPRGTA